AEAVQLGVIGHRIAAVVVAAAWCHDLGHRGAKTTALMRRGWTCRECVRLDDDASLRDVLEAAAARARSDAAVRRVLAVP
ncbi:MAG: hypothetical protein ACRES2_03150, partial [Steroidobacteraceae bacterium]